MTDNVDLINKCKKAHSIQIDVDYIGGLLPSSKAFSIIEGEEVEGAKLTIEAQHIVRLQHLFLILIEEERRAVVSLPQRCTRRRPCVQPAATGRRELAWRHRRCRPALNPPLFAVRVLPASSRSRHSPLQALAASFSVSIPREDRHQEWWWISHDWRGSTEPPNSTISAADGGSDGVSTHPCYRSTMGFSLPHRESTAVGAAPRIVISGGCPRVRRLPRKKPPSVVPSCISIWPQISWVRHRRIKPRSIPCSPHNTSTTRSAVVGIPGIEFSNA
ncbi:uncharacterized protein LOC107611759 [Arachis ipaensis]|uniref:uncharacterized protein LOC107611759 n=1 Tax=Arachis ipaensis TaxID=130454 RepID=UPI0007AFDA91|nr:uncharacterized protein LOC107611759 [Arachis ipaensis]XP_029150805.1 uncharacterized protein LOC114925818 [Arachis hypogaea]